MKRFLVVLAAILFSASVVFAVQSSLIYGVNNGNPVPVQVDANGNIYVNTSIGTATNTPTPSATATKTSTPTNTATNTVTQTPTVTNTFTQVAHIIVQLPQASLTATPYTTPPPGYITDLYVTRIDNCGVTQGSVGIYLGSTLFWGDTNGLCPGCSTGSFWLRGDGVSNWGLQAPSQAGATINVNITAVLRGVTTPVPVY